MPKKRLFAMPCHTGPPVPFPHPMIPRASSSAVITLATARQATMSRPSSSVSPHVHILAHTTLHLSPRLQEPQATQPRCGSATSHILKQQTHVQTAAARQRREHGLHAPDLPVVAAVVVVAAAALRVAAALLVVAAARRWWAVGAALRARCVAGGLRVRKVAHLLRWVVATGASAAAGSGAAAVVALRAGAGVVGGAAGPGGWRSRPGGGRACRPLWDLEVLLFFYILILLYEVSGWRMIRPTMTGAR